MKKQYLFLTALWVTTSLPWPQTGAVRESRTTYGYGNKQAAPAPQLQGMAVKIRVNN